MKTNEISLYDYLTKVGTAKAKVIAISEPKAQSDAEILSIARLSFEQKKTDLITGALKPSELFLRLSQKKSPNVTFKVEGLTNELTHMFVSQRKLNVGDVLTIKLNDLSTEKFTMVSDVQTSPLEEGSLELTKDETTTIN